MKTTSQIKQVAVKYDKAILLLLKAALAIILLNVTLKVVFDMSSIWVANATLAAVLLCFIGVILRKVITGQKYAQGAKQRRRLLLPFFYPQKKKNLH
jgi:hypothetical protein